MVTARGLKTNLRLAGLLSVLTGIFLGVGLLLGGESGMVIALLFAGVFNFGSYWFSDRIVLKLYGAEEIEPGENPDLHSMVEKLSENAGIPKPRLYRNSMKAPNAFATGRNPEKGVICVTEGLMEQLEKEEVEGVLAHELAHIKNRDTLVNATVATIAGAIALIARMAFWGAMLSGRRDNSEAVSSLAFVIITPLIATVVKMAISRRMEFRADASGVKIHGQKEGLASALRKISSANRSSRYRASQVKEAGANLFIENPFSGDRLTGLFSTHPPLEKRLDNIESVEI